MPGNFEYQAARIIARFTGEHVIIQDDGSRNSMPDFRIDYASKPPGYVEAVIDIDPRYAAMDHELSRQEPIPAALSWWVHCTGKSPRLKDLRIALTRILGPLRGTPSLRAQHELASMHVRVAGPWLAPVGQANAIHVLPEGITSSAAPDWPAYLHWIKDFLTSGKTRDVRRKLAATGAAERHAFIAASFTTASGAYFAVADDNYFGEPSELPPAPPELPPEISHLWTWSIPGLNRCLAWFPSTGWIDVQNHWATD